MTCFLFSFQVLVKRVMYLNRSLRQWEVEMSLFLLEILAI
jgi:hypothetical protein